MSISTRKLNGYVSSKSSVPAQRLADDLLRLADDGVEVGLVLEALGVDLVDVLGARRPGREPAAGRHHLQPADRRAVPGARVSFAVIGSPASPVAFTISGDSFFKIAFCSGVAGASMRV